MIYNVKIRSKKTLFKKIIFLIFFLFFCFFIKSCNVFAEEIENQPLDAIRETYIGYIMNDFTKVTGGHIDIEDLTDGENINHFTFREVINALEPNFPYFVIGNQYHYSENQVISNTYNYVILFSQVPTSYYYRQNDDIYVNNNRVGSYQKEYELFSNNGSPISCYVFEPYEPSGVTYGLVHGKYYQDCSKNQYNGIGFSFFNNINYDVNGNYLQKTSDYVITLNNFNLYNTTSKETINANVKDNIIVPEDNARVDTRNWFEKIIDGILSIPTKIYNFFVSLFDFIHDFFIPDADLFNSFIVEEYDYLQSRLGFMMYPITLITDFFNRFNSIPNSANATFTIPDVSFMSHTLIHQSSINLNDIVNSNTIFQYIYNIYQVVVSGLIVIWVAKLGYKKFNETYGGGYK